MSETTKTSEEQWMEKIDSMSHMEMATLYRFAPSGHPIFSTSGELFDHFMKRFNELGGMSPEISKRIGW